MGNDGQTQTGVEGEGATMTNPERAGDRDTERGRVETEEVVGTSRRPLAGCSVSVPVGCKHCMSSISVGQHFSNNVFNGRSLKDR